MITGRRASDWLRVTASAQNGTSGEDERQGLDRRATDRRAPRRRLDPLFMASLVNQIMPGGAAPPVFAYKAAAPSPRRGARINFRA